jgi:hypothetical protein
VFIRSCRKPVDVVPVLVAAAPNDSGGPAKN